MKYQFKGYFGFAGVRFNNKKLTQINARVFRTILQEMSQTGFGKLQIDNN